MFKYKIMWIYPEQLILHLKKELKFVYVLFGNDLCILQDSYINIIKVAKNLNFQEHINIELNIYYEWNKIFNLFRELDLLKRKKIILLKFPDTYPTNYFNKYILLLSSLLHDEILLILHIHTFNHIKKTNFDFHPLIKKGVFILCIQPKNEQLITWITNQAAAMQLFIEKSACKLLCYYYGDDLILLKQTLQILSLIYSDKNLSFVRVKNVITVNTTCFSVNHWIEAILIGNKKRADYILQQLKYININIEVLLQKIQHEIYILTHIKYELILKKPLFNLLKTYKIYDKHHCILLSYALRRLSIDQLYQSLALLVHMELVHKKKFSYISTFNFRLLTTILCSSLKK